MLLRILPRLVGLADEADVAATLREHLRTLPERYAAKAPRGLADKWRRVAELQVAELLDLPDDELLKHQMDLEFRGFEDN